MARITHPFVSVVVCTLNGADHLGETLAALRGQTYPKAAYEIVVIDDGSTDETAHIAQTFDVRLVRHGKNLGLGVARNSGLKAARGEIIAYTDDDCLPDSRWLEELVAPYGDERVMATGGHTFAVSEVTPTERYMDSCGYGNPAPYGISGGNSPISRLVTYVRQMVSPLHLRVRNLETLQEIYTLNASYRVGLLRGIGGFDENLRAAEDSDVSARLYEAYSGRVIVFAQNARVGHRHRRRFWPWVRQTFERSQDAFVQIRKEGRIPPLFPFPVMTILFGLAGLVFGVQGGVLALLVSPIMLYWWWQIRLKGRHMTDRLRFPYMQFVLESATLCGYATAFIRGQK